MIGGRFLSRRPPLGARDYATTWSPACKGTVAAWVAHLLATMVRVHTFVGGVPNSEEFAEGKHEGQARSS